jgi:hypothetical protein
MSYEVKYQVIISNKSKACGMKSLERTPDGRLAYFKMESLRGFAGLYIELFDGDRFNQVWSEHGEHLPIELSLSDKEATEKDFEEILSYARKILNIILDLPEQPQQTTIPNSSPFGG